MPAAAVLLLSLGAAGYGLVAPPRRAFVLLVGVGLLIPAPLGIPTGGWIPNLTVGRLVELALLVGLVVRVARGRTPATVFRVTRVHLALGLYFLVVLVVGVADASGTAPPDPWPALLEQIELVGVFVVGLALIRSIDDLNHVVRTLAGVAVLLGVIGVVEHVTQDSWGHFWFSHLPSQQGVDPAAILGHRGGDVRVRASADFPLEYSWLVAALLPALLVTAVRVRRARVPLALAAVVVTALGEYWSYSRSVVIGLVIAAVGLAATSRHRRVVALVAVTVAVVVLAIVAVPSLTHNYSQSIDQGSINVRTNRLPIILGYVAQRPVTGLGLNGLIGLGFPTTDSSYLKTYSEMGVVGAAALVALVATAVACGSRGVRTRNPELRLASAVAATALATLVASSIAYDSFSVGGSIRLFWVLTALGVAAGERAFGPVAVLRRPPASSLVLRIGAVPVAVFVGLAVAASAPQHWAVEYEFRTLPLQQEVGSHDPVTQGKTLINTACTPIERLALTRDGVSVRCAPAYSAAAGIGDLRVQTRHYADLAAFQSDVLTVLRDTAGMRAFELLPSGPLSTGRPTVLVTAPISLGVIAAEAGLLLPVRAPRRRQSAGAAVGAIAPRRPAVSALT